MNRLTSLCSRLVSLVALLAFGALATCSSASKNGAAADAADSGAPEGGGDDASAIQVPPSPAGAALTWLLAAVNGMTPTEADVNARFTTIFLAKIPAVQVLSVFAQLSPAGPWALVGFDGAPTPASLMAVVTRGDGHYWRIFVALDVDGKIGGLLFTGAGELDPALRSWESIEQAAGAMPGRVNMLAGAVDGAACTPIRGLANDASLAVGSTFKLWVLAALAADVQAGKHAWTDTMAIEDAYKSLPSGMLQDEPAGTMLSLREIANQMISISDNTAADHLLFFLGRQAVEAMLPITGHHDPAQNQPFLATREMFTLKLMVTPAEQQAYLQASTPQKRLLLAQYDAAYDPRLYAGPPWIAPRAIDTLEWFATPMDLCNVMRVLRDGGEQPATQPVRDILSINPGIVDTSRAFSYVGFKGGSERGVLNLTWLLRRQVDQKWLFFTMGFNDPADDIDADAALYLAGAARALLATP